MGLVAVLCVAFVLHLRTLAASPDPVFVIEHEIEIAAPPEDVWRVLTDFAAYPEWNPYVLRLGGTLEPGGAIAVTIAQSNWPKPLTVHPTIVTLDAPRELRWHGSALTTGFLETDHYFRLEPLAGNRTRLRHAEEFRGWRALRIDNEEHHQHTRAAFQAMNRALAARVGDEQ
ncbi:MAG: SRPBCC domain-containing protein [Candidatus Binatia bacterium]|nr:SRPBCC domain-containing protein [Candidatus Binatia bacterium]